MLDVFIYCLAVYNDVVQVDEKSLQFELGNNEVQRVLKRRGFVCKHKWN